MYEIGGSQLHKSFLEGLRSHELPWQVATQLTADYSRRCTIPSSFETGVRSSVPWPDPDLKRDHHEILPIGAKAAPTPDLVEPLSSKAHQLFSL